MLSNILIEGGDGLRLVNDGDDDDDGGGSFSILASSLGIAIMHGLVSSTSVMLTRLKAFLKMPLDNEALALSVVWSKEVSSDDTSPKNADTASAAKWGSLWYSVNVILSFTSNEVVSSSSIVV